jgi:MFS family permease
LFVDGLAAAIPLRFLTGMFLAGVYPVGMKLMVSWSQPSDRGRAFGVLLAALTLGSALPHLISGLAPLPWRSVMLAAAAVTAAGAVIAVGLIRPGPQLDIRVAGSCPRSAIAIFTDRETRLVSFGYFGHMWELYALWTWLATFVAAGRAQLGDATSPTGLIVFAAIGVAGMAGCLLGGWASDLFGRPRAALVALVVSGACCTASPVFFTAPTAILIVFLLVWGAAVIADSGAFSTSLSETTDPRYVGTVLTAQTAVGFLLTVVTIQLTPLVAGLVGWQYAFLLLAPGPLIGAMAMSALRVATHQPRPTEETHDQKFNAHNPVRRSDRGTLAHRR